MVRAKYWQFLTKSYLNKIFPVRQTGTLCHKMKPPYITMCLSNCKTILKDTICLLFKDAK